MENNESLFSPANPHFFQPLLTDFESHLTIPATFFSKHIQGKHEGKTVQLRSDASDRTWKVKMEGHRLTDGWKEFAKAHDFRVGDVVIFRHEGDMLFHVTPFGTSFCEIQYVYSASHYKYKEESDVIGEESSSKLTCFSQSVTVSNLSRGAVGVPLDFASQNGLNKGRRVIALRNQEGKTWESELKTTSSGQVFICRNWRSFCTASKLKVGDSFQLKLLQNKERPVFQLCSRLKGRPKKETLSEEGDKTENPRFVKITPTASSLENGKQHLPVHFTRANKLNRPGKIVLVDKDKVEWSMKLKADTRSMYIIGGKGWKSFCAANEVLAGESLTLELIRRGRIPVLKFCSKVKKETLTEEDNLGETPRFVKITTTASSLEIGRQHLPVHFTRGNKLKRPGKIVLVDKDNVEWSMKLNEDIRSGTMYIMGGKGWKSFCAANEVVVGEPLTLELIRRGRIPFLKFCSKLVFRWSNHRLKQRLEDAREHEFRD
ncbi:B3 domain-containing protein REM8-like isoform X2 [Raphanus sativus]|uniref:B3 domain-containing protein REM8-like isoform X2 n=1 Tax=Raphanus sativus TaxID=3726 RepID=A0A9W3D7U3_RAPSA|nr:B3 domain-containing protein REM8-like isoform X2 [Raphanus sativus]